MFVGGTVSEHSKAISEGKRSRWATALRLPTGMKKYKDENAVGC
jgi:hypothetical protein